MSSNATDTSNQDLPKVVITLGVLAGALIIGLIVAKLADYLYERSSVRDDASDISEHTRELLKTQLELMRMGKHKDKKDDKKDDPEAERETATKAMGVWSNKVKAKAKLNTIPESGEGTTDPSPASFYQESSSSEGKNKGKAGGAVAYKVPDASKKDDTKKYQDAVKVWNEVEKNSEQKAGSKGNSPAKVKSEKAATTSKETTKASPKKSTANDSPNKKSTDSKSKPPPKDDEFEVPANIAAPKPTSTKTTNEKKNTKSSGAVIPANLNKNTDIRPITPAKVDENMPGYMRPKTPFNPRNFSRYNGTVDPTRSSTDKNAPGGSSKTS